MPNAPSILIVEDESIVAPARVSYWGADHRLRFANNAFLAWLGHQPETVVGKLSEEVLPRPWFTTLKPRLDEALKGQT